MTTTQPPTKRTKPPKASRLRPSPGPTAPREIEPPAADSPPTVPAAGVPQFAPPLEALPEAATEPQVQPESAPVPKPAPILPPPPPKPPDILVAISGTAFHQFDVVQVLDTNTRHYGMFFTLGDIRFGKAHGYHLQDGGKQEFITVPAEGIFYIGRAKIRSRVPCSPKWISDHR